MSRHAIGVDLGGTRIKVGLVDCTEGLMDHTEVPTNAQEGPERVLDRIIGAIRDLLKPHESTDLKGIGIGSPGYVNWERTTISNAPNLPGWSHVNLRDELQDRWGAAIPVVAENDANVAGLGSAFFGAGQAYDSFVMVTLGTGVGGAIIYQNEIFRGSTGGAGEIGHVSIDYEGPLDRAGVAGAIEAYLGQNFLSRHARYRLLNEDSAIHETAGDDLEDINPRLIYEAAAKGDQPCQEVLAWAGHKLGCVLGSVANLLDIYTFVVGGGISGAGEYILDPARESTRRYTAAGMRERTKIVRETLGNEVAMLGAAQLVC